MRWVKIRLEHTRQCLNSTKLSLTKGSLHESEYSTSKTMFPKLGISISPQTGPKQVLPISLSHKCHKHTISKKKKTVPAGLKKKD